MRNENEGAGWRHHPETIDRVRKLLAEIKGRPTGTPIVETKLSELGATDGKPTDAPPQGSEA